MPNDNTLGVLLLGCYIAVTLYGLTSHQMYRYFRMYPNDQVLLKSMVATMWSLDTLHTIFVIHACYFYLVTNYFNLQAIEKSVWSLRLSLLLTGLITTIAHGFFSRRIYIFSRNVFTTSTIMGISVLRMCGIVAMTILAFVFPTFARFGNIIWLVCLTVGFSIASDMIITVSLCWFLQKSKTGFQRTDSIIDKLLLYAINTGLLCIIFDSVVLICARAMKNNLIYIGLYFVISKLYSNSLLAVLNSRSGIVRDNQHGSFELQDVPVPHQENMHDPHVLNLRRRQPHITNLGFSLNGGESMSVQQALDQLKSHTEDDSDSHLHQSSKGLELQKEISNSDSETMKVSPNL